MRQFCKGSSLVEYALIGLLVLAASIGGFLLIGQNLDSILAAFRGDMEKPVQTAALVSQQMAQAAEAQAAAEAAAAAITPGGVGGIVPAPTGSQAQLCAEGGVCMNIPVYPAGTEQVAGANGGSFTNQYASALQSIADQLAAQNADPALVDLITKAANAGNALGNAETDMIALCYPGELCGYGDTLENLNHAKAVANNVISTNDAFRSNWNQLNNYLSSHPEAMTPQVAEFIRVMAAEINQIGDKHRASAAEALNGEYFNEPNILFTESLANTDVITKTDAENICNTAKGCEIQG